MSAGKSEQDTVTVDEPTNNVVPSFSFSGCGFLGVYHVGVGACLRDHTDVVRRHEIKFAGASAGALVATTLLCDIHFGDVTRLLLEIANSLRNRENVDLDALLRQLMHQTLPEDAHIHLRNRLFISMTMLKGLEGVLVTDFESKDQLIDCLLASSFVPGFTGWIPPALEEGSFVNMKKQFPGALEKDTKVLESKVEDDDCAAKTGIGEQFKTMKMETLMDILVDDYHENSRMTDDEKIREKADKESYLSYLVKLCFFGFNTTNKVVSNIPVASNIVKHFIPSGLSGVDSFMEIIVTELLSNKQIVLDGGFSDNVPCFDTNTFTVSPFSGECDICPHDLTALDLSFDLARTSMQVSEDNIFRLTHALNPMDPKMLLKLCEEGYNECLRFLNRKNLLSCKKHLMTRATLSTSPCNIGHAHCKCNICQESDGKIRSSLACLECHRIKNKATRSHLPDDVQQEFQKAISDYESQTTSTSFWNRLVSLLWWFVEKTYSHTMGLTELSIDFYSWLLRFGDNLACFAKYAILPLGQKRKLVRCVLSSLRVYIGASARQQMKTLTFRS